MGTSEKTQNANFAETEFSEVRAGLRKDVLFGQRTLVLFLLRRVVDCLSDDLAVLDHVGVGPIPYPDVVVLVGPLQESLAKVTSSRLETGIYMRRKGIQPFACSAKRGARGAQSGSGAITGPLTRNRHRIHWVRFGE
jgi:hypothetical protein